MDRINNIVIKLSKEELENVARLYLEQLLSKREDLLSGINQNSRQKASLIAQYGNLKDELRHYGLDNGGEDKLYNLAIKGEFQR
ncbi:MAG TPA: hypothetical protein VMC07_00110 [Candidatus Omnitrophota bacterium]|nr:hypothetical protein [Candidatus Omnitrophota bacterium]